MRPLIAQATTTTTEPTIEVVEPRRPLTDFLVDVFDLDPDGSSARLMESIVEPVFQVIVIVLITWASVRLVLWIGNRAIERARGRSLPRERGRSAEAADRRRQRLDALEAVLASVVRVTAWSIALLYLLTVTFGINVAPLIAGAGIVGLAIGFGAQDLIKDFVSGAFMLLEDQYGVGDIIDVGDATGKVEKVTLRTTRLRDVTGTVWHFPNGEIRRVGNLSQEWSRALLDVGVAYGTDIDHASSVIQSVAEAMADEPEYRELFLDRPEVWGVEDMAADAVLIRLVIKTLPGEQWPILRELRGRLKRAFDEEGIEIPFPQRTVWMRDGDAADRTHEQS